MQWRGMSPRAMQLFMEAPNAGEMEAPDGEAWSGTVSTGRYMRVQVRLRDGAVARAQFGTSGCAPCIAAGAYVTTWAQGRPLSEMDALTDRDVLSALGGLPVRRAYCAALAVDALKAAVRNARVRHHSGTVIT